MEKISDPKIFGPVMWYNIHKLSLKLTEDCYIAYIKELIPIIPCSTCKQHAIEYLKLNPLKEFIGVKDPTTGDNIGMFKWSWIFHNSVNERLGKNIMNFDTAFNMYNDISQICSLECGN